jgi:hemerythrin
MFGLCNDLSSMVASTRPKADIVKLVDKMVQHLEQHFKTEELTRMRMHRPMSAVHLDNHAKLLQEAQDWLGKLRVGAPVERDLVNFFVYTVIKDHIARESNMFNPAARLAVTAAVASQSDKSPSAAPLLDDGEYGSPEFTEPAPLSERGFLSFDDADDWPKTVFMRDGAGSDANSSGRSKVFIWRD